MNLTHMEIQEVICQWLMLIMKNKEAIDISVGVEERLNVSRNDLNAAVRCLKEFGDYFAFYTQKPDRTHFRVLCRPCLAPMDNLKIKKINYFDIRKFKKLMKKKATNEDQLSLYCA